jgi:hypothetical protein
MGRVEFHNTTALSDQRLLVLCREGLRGWALGRVVLRVRYSRGADFSGTCFYSDRRIHVNLGKHLSYPYMMKTYLARAEVVGRRWHKPLYTLQLRDGYEVALFVFMHELYHLLIKRARRNTRQKESMCDRFAARFLVDRCGAIVRNGRGKQVPREEWDFQDLDTFVAAARDRRMARPVAARRKLNSTSVTDGQLMLFQS